jgi:hypothetical protein
MDGDAGLTSANGQRSVLASPIPRCRTEVIHEPRSPVSPALVALATAVLACVIAFDLLAVNYAAGIVFVAAVELVMFAMYVSAPTGRRTDLRNWRQRVSTLFLLGANVAIMVLVIVSLRQEANEIGDEPIFGDPSHIVASKYHLVLKPTDDEAKTFVVEEELVLGDGTGYYQALVVLHQNPLASTSAGFLVREALLPGLASRPADAQIMRDDGSSRNVSINPGYPGLIVTIIPTGQRAEGTTFLRISVCRPTCPDSEVELRDFPAGSFRRAAGADHEANPSVQDKEIITWRLSNLSRDVAFTFVDPRYRWLAPFVGPFLGLSSVRGLPVVLAGMIGVILPLAIAWIAKPVLIELVKQIQKGWVEMRFGTTLVRRLAWKQERKTNRPQIRRSR